MAANASWSPGPWVAVNRGTDDEPMMSVMAARIAGQPPRHCVAICATGDSPQAMEDANAALIAAAPDLVQQLQQAEMHLVVLANNAWDAAKTDPRWGGVYEKLVPVIDDIRAALSKAKGEAPTDE